MVNLNNLILISLIKWFYPLPIKIWFHGKDTNSPQHVKQQPDEWHINVPQYSNKIAFNKRIAIGEKNDYTFQLY